MFQFKLFYLYISIDNIVRILFIESSNGIEYFE
jgi:hypothetical protein